MRDEMTYNEAIKSFDFVSFFTDWKQTRMNSVWLAKKVDIETLAPGFLSISPDEVCEPTFHGAKLVRRIHPSGGDHEACITSGFGLWFNKIYHFSPDLEPSTRETDIQSELIVSLQDFPRAVEHIYRLMPLFADKFRISEIRPIAADSIPLSGAKGRDAMAITWTWSGDFDSIQSPVMQIQ